MLFPIKEKEYLIYKSEKTRNFQFLPTQITVEVTSEVEKEEWFSSLNIPVSQKVELQSVFWKKKSTQGATIGLNYPIIESRIW